MGRYCRLWRDYWWLNAVPGAELSQPLAVRAGTVMPKTFALCLPRSNWPIVPELEHQLSGDEILL